MCKGTCLEKCQVCYQKGYSCCKTQPVFRPEELARAYFECDIFNELPPLHLTPIGNGFIVVDRNWVKEDNTFTVDEHYCLFLDQTTGKCRIYDYRPEVCRKYGESEELPCPFEDIGVNDMKNITKEEAQKFIEKANMKSILNKEKLLKIEDMLNIKTNIKILDVSPKAFKEELKNLNILQMLYAVVYFLQDMPINVLNIKTEYKYHLILLKDGNKNKFSSIREIVFSSDNPHIKNLCKVHNSLNRFVLFRNRTVLELVVDKLNKILKGLNLDISKEIDELKKSTHKELENAIKIYYTLSFINQLISYKKTPKAVKSRLNKLNASELIKIAYAVLIHLYAQEDVNSLLETPILNLYKKLNEVTPGELRNVLNKIDKFNQNFIKLLTK